MLKFAKAMMWVLQHVFEENNVDEERRTKNEDTKDNWRELYPWMIVEPDEKEGEFVLKEIMHTGNFGKFDKRYNWNIKTPLKRFIANQKWNVHLITHYPSEILWSPFFNIYRYFLVKKWMRTVKG